MHLDNVIGRFLPCASNLEVVSRIRRVPDMESRLLNARVLVIDDSQLLLLPLQLQS